jgi:hypothetical protein
MIEQILHIARTNIAAIRFTLDHDEMAWRVSNPEHLVSRA